MHVFVTGGTGTIGTPVVAELLANGHTVVGLARSEASMAALEKAGATTIRGGLADLDALRDGAAQADGVISLAFGSDYSTAEALAASIAEEGTAMSTLGDALVGTGKPYVVVSGTPWAVGRPSIESDPLPHEGPVAGRALSVEAALALSSRGVRSSAVRMPRTVHEGGEGGFAGLLTPAVHARDAAVLFRLALEKAPAGTAWHAVADEGDAVIDIATVVGRRLRLPVQQVPDETFGPFGPIFAADQPSSSAYTREALGWEPTHPSLLADLEELQP
jgi:nucleoside-diphosphate-sugar epimerase